MERLAENSTETSIKSMSNVGPTLTQELQLELEAVRLRLLRRSQIIDVLRSAYVRDVVMIKNELMRKSGMTDEVQYNSIIRTICDCEYTCVP